MNKQDIDNIDDLENEPSNTDLSNLELISDQDYSEVIEDPQVLHELQLLQEFGY